MESKGEGGGGRPPVIDGRLEFDSAAAATSNDQPEQQQQHFREFRADSIVWVSLKLIIIFDAERERESSLAAHILLNLVVSGCKNIGNRK